MPSASSKSIKIAFILVTALFLLWGLSYGLIDVMNKNFQNQLGITKATSGLLQAAYFGGYFVFATPASLVARKYGYKGGIIMGLALYAAGALMIIPASNAHSFQIFLVAFFINYSVEHWQGLSDSRASYFFSIALVAFLIGRVVTTPLMKKWSAGKILGAYSSINVILVVLLNIVTGSPSVFLLIALFFFMSISFPTIFALSIVNLPQNLVKTASSIIIMSIVGGAIMPFFMGLMADMFNTAAGYLLLIPCFLYVAWYGFKGCHADEPEKSVQP